MPVFRCPKCGQVRNYFDRVGNVCAKCYVVSRPDPPPMVFNKVLCQACGNYRSGEPKIRYCFQCLQSGAWLYHEAKKRGLKIRQKTYEKGEKPRASFGR